MNISILGSSRSGHNFLKDNLELWTGLKITDVENPESTKQGDIIIICMRDYLNNVASLSKIRVSHIDKSIKSWIFLVKESFGLSNLIANKYTVFYEKFKNSELYRREICNIVKGVYNEDKLKVFPKKGMISSFYKDEIKENETSTDFYKKFAGKADQLETNIRWKQILENKKDKGYYISKLKEFPEAIELYIKYYTPNEEQLQFLKENKII